MKRVYVEQAELKPWACLSQRTGSYAKFASKPSLSEWVVGSKPSQTHTYIKLSAMALPEVLTLVLFSGLIVIQPLPTLAWDADLELFDLVEEIPQTFYEFLSVNQVRPI